MISYFIRYVNKGTGQEGEYHTVDTSSEGALNRLYDYHKGEDLRILEFLSGAEADAREELLHELDPDLCAD